MQPDTSSVKYASVRFHKPSQTLPGRCSIYTDTKGYRDNAVVVSFSKMMQLLPQGDNSNGQDFNCKFYPQIGDEFYVIEESLAAALYQLKNSITEAIQAAYDAGKEDGKKALVLLNTGEMSIKDFEKKK